ncbi:mechanosensitive ion channel family protein [Nocardioides sp. GCM10027113]|uniref:mechanosensitive ion channel family protein n=1 Tax=unclassified Nocardioides TaxID=2615069 RepID=UPI00360C0285
MPFSLSSKPCAPDEFLCERALEWTGNEDVAAFADLLIGKPLKIITILVIGLVARWVLHRLVNRLIKKAENGVLPDRVSRVALGGSRSRNHGSAPRDVAGATRRVQRAQTMGSLLKSIITGIIVAVIVTMVLAEVNVNVAPIIASAGILGLALGFGAQSLVSDFLSGVFMIFEDQYGVGDVVDLGEAIGTVEAVSLRVTRLRDVNGTVWYVRNGEIMRVGNMSQNWSRTVLDISVGYGEDLARVKRVLQDVAHDLWEDEDYKGIVIEEPEVWGVEQLAADGVTVRVTLKTAPLEQWAVAREMRQRIKDRFDFEGIEIPFPQRVVWHRDQPTDAAGARDAQVADQA